MGIAERDYERGRYGGSPGVHLGRPRSMWLNLLLMMVAIYVVQVITRGTFPDDGWFTKLFALDADFWRRPWQFYELLTYGFLHSPFSLMHIVGNGLGLWIFGGWTEERYGQKEFLTLFLASIVLSGLFWCFAEFVAQNGDPRGSVIGASGGITALMVVGVLNYPRRILLIWGIVPVPAWLLGIIWIGNDLVGVLGRTEEAEVAYFAHLGGALFGLVYYKARWRLSSRLPSRWSWPKFRLPRRHNLRVHHPDEPNEDTDGEVDDILRKIQRQGQDSLTDRERRILQRASKEYQQKRR